MLLTLATLRSVILGGPAAIISTGLPKQEKLKTKLSVNYGLCSGAGTLNFPETGISFRNALRPQTKLVIAVAFLQLLTVQSI